jgi:hypothetical protein
MHQLTEVLLGRAVSGIGRQPLGPKAKALLLTIYQDAGHRFSNPVLACCAGDGRSGHVLEGAA